MKQGVAISAASAGAKPLLIVAVADDDFYKDVVTWLGAQLHVCRFSECDFAMWTGASHSAAVLLCDPGFVNQLQPASATWLAENADLVPMIQIVAASSTPSFEHEHLLPKPAAFVYRSAPEQHLTTTVMTLLRMAQQARQHRKILDHFNESYVAVDSTWRVTYINATAARLLQVDPANVVGKSAWDVFPQAANSERTPIYRRVMEQRVAAKIEGFNPAVGWFEIEAMPTDDGGVAMYLRNATALKEAEAAVMASERRLRLFLEHARNYALAVTDTEGVILEWLGGAEAIVGWTAEECIGRPIELIFTPEDRACGLVSQEFDDAARKGRAEDKRWHLRKDNSRFFADGVTVALYDEVGHLQGFGKVFRDATREKIAEEALLQSQDQLRLIFSSVADGIFGMAPDGTCTFLNPAAAAAFGYQFDELSGQCLHDMVHHHRADGSVYPAVDCKIREAIREGKTLRASDEVFWRKDGTCFPVRYSVNPMLHGDVITGAVVAFTDTTDSQRAEAALRESEHRLRSVLDFMPQKVFTANPAGAIDYFNPAWMAYTGLPFEQISGWGWVQIIHPDDVHRKVQVWQAAVETMSTFQYELRFRDKHGEYRWHISRALPLRDEHGQLTMWIGSATDIHDVKKLEVKLSQELAAEKQNAALLADVAAASHAINSVLSLDSIVNVLTEKARSILEVDEVRVVLTKTESWHAPVDATDGAQNNLASRHRADGDGALIAPLIGHGDRDLGLVQVEPKAGRQFGAGDEAVLAQLAAIAAVGIENAYLYESVREQDRHKDEFLATLAHELRNPLAPLRTGLDLLKVTAADNNAEKIRCMMERQLAHMVRLVDDLMDVSRVSRGKVELKREWVTLQAILEPALEASRPQILAAHHELIVDIPTEPIAVYGDLTRLAQIVSNLLNNAAKYTPDGGRIELRAHAQAGAVIIEIIDSGIGIPPEMLSQIFELFTQVAPSTDRSRGGLGIGLALVQKLIEMHGGTVSADSPGLGQGSTFTIKLPLRPGGHQYSVEKSQPLPKQMGKRILVVDDNVEAAETLSMLLQFAGHEVQTAHDGYAALEVVRRFAPAVIFLDIGLPGMSGYEVATQLRTEPLSRDTIIVALTGWGGEDDRRRSREAGFDFHLTKPVDAKTLFEVLSRFFPNGAVI